MAVPACAGVEATVLSPVSISVLLYPLPFRRSMRPSAPLPGMIVISVLSSSSSATERDQPPGPVTGLGQETGEDLHDPAAEAAVRRRQRRPAGHVRIVARQLGISGSDAGFLRSCARLLRYASQPSPDAPALLSRETPWHESSSLEGNLASPRQGALSPLAGRSYGSPEGSATVDRDDASPLEPVPDPNGVWPGLWSHRSRDAAGGAEEHDALPVRAGRAAGPARLPPRGR